MNPLGWAALAAVVVVAGAIVHLARRFDELELLLEGHLIDHEEVPTP